MQTILEGMFWPNVRPCMILSTPHCIDNDALCRNTDMTRFCVSCGRNVKASHGIVTFTADDAGTHLLLNVFRGILHVLHLLLLIAFACTIAKTPIWSQLNRIAPADPGLRTCGRQGLLQVSYHLSIAGIAFQSTLCNNLFRGKLLTRHWILYSSAVCICIWK